MSRPARSIAAMACAVTIVLATLLPVVTVPPTRALALIDAPAAA